MKVAEQRLIEQETIQKIISIIVKEISPEKIILFGSRAKGNMHKDSDYDICVLKTGIENIRKVKHKLYYDLYDAKEAIDLVVNTPEKFEILKEDKYLVYKNIYQDGVILYERR
jgi:predicted nucleotidyltransferase